MSTLEGVWGMPSSPRARRRAAWLTAAVVVAAVVAGVALLVPGSTPPKATPTTNEGPAQLAIQNNGHLTAADIHAINATLDRFLPAGVDRRSMTTAWLLAGPELKAGSTLAQWRAGSTPIPSYPLRGTTFHDWTPVDIGKNTVDFNLLVHHRPEVKIGDWVFAGQMIRIDSHWLVNRLYTTAIMNPVRGSQHEIGPADFGASPSQAAPAPSKPPLSKPWILLLAAIVGLAILFPLSLGLVALVRGHLWRRRHVTPEMRAMPPLPSSAREPQQERQREAAGSRRP